MSASKIAVIGASGHTGRFVVDELRRRGIEPIAVTRERVGDLSDAAKLDGALVGAAAVINCAGPFVDSARAVIEAALRAGIHYLDVTAEQRSALDAFEAFDAPARAANVAIVPVAAFYGGLGDLLTSAAIGDWASADEATIAIALDRWWPTQGTRRTGARNTVARLVLRDGKLEAQETPRATAVWNFGDSFGAQDVVELPFTETILLARHLRLSSIRNFINEAPLNDLRDPATGPPQAADAMGRSAQRFLVEAVVRREDLERRATASGRDIYAVTAPLVVEAVQRIVGGEVLQRGVRALGSLVDARGFLDALVARYSSLEVSYT